MTSGARLRRASIPKIHRLAFYDTPYHKQPLNRETIHDERRSTVGDGGVMASVASRSQESGRAARSTDPAVLESIGREGVNLAIWQRALSGPLRAAVDGLDLAPGAIRLAGGPLDVGEMVRQALEDGGVEPGRAHVVAADVAALAILFADRLRLKMLEVRLEQVVGNACHRWHADHVAVRLITTYRGPGTQWLDSEAAGRLVDGRLPGRDDYQELATGDIGLFKGRTATDMPAVHRSPPIGDTGGSRLLLVIDPGQDER